MKNSHKTTGDIMVKLLNINSLLKASYKLVSLGVFSLVLLCSKDVLASGADAVAACAMKGKMTQCQINSSNTTQIYPQSRIQNIQSTGDNGCFDPMPTQVSQVREEVCLRPDSCFKYPNGQQVTVGGEVKCLRQHEGMDLAAPKGTPVTAAADGYIVTATDCYGGGGNTIIMKHPKVGGGFYTTTYMHLSEFEKSVTSKAGTSDLIAKGTRIGYVGGSSCKNGTTKQDVYGMHLHFELRDGDTGTGQILSPTCASAQALCDANAPVVAEPIVPISEPQPEVTSASASLTGCGKLYPADNLSEFHQRGESLGDAGAFNQCWAKDTGGCSYGLSQMVCYKDSSKWNNSTVAKYLQYLQKNDPAKYKALEVGGSLQTTIQTACNPSTAKTFAEKWKALAASDSTFGDSQTQYIEDNYLSYGYTLLKRAGLQTLLNRSPEVQMVILAGSVASPGAMKKNFLAVEEALKPTPIEKATDEEIITAYYNSYAEVMYASYNPKTSFEKRAAIDKQMALESLQIRKEMESGKDLNEASMAATGKRACAKNESPKANVTVSLGTSSRTYIGVDYAGASAVDSSDDGERDCSVKNYRNSFQYCIFCDLFEIIFNTASVVAKKSYNTLANAVISLVCVGFALWLGLTVMQFVSSMEQKNPSILVKTILNKAFVIVLIVMILRMDSIQFFQLALEPLFNTGFRLAQFVMAGEDGATCSGGYDILTEEKGAGLPSSMGVSILCSIETIQDKLLDIMALGSASICVACYIESWFNLPIFPHLGYLIIGVCLWIAAIMLMIMYPFLLVDSVLQLCVSTALLPAAIGCFAFKMTQKYVKKVWDVFLNCMFNFVFLSIILYILTNGLIDLLSDIGISANSDVMNAGNSTSYNTILTKLAWWGVAFLKLLFYMVLSWAVLGEANAFAGNFAKSLGIKDIGGKIGGLAASTTNNIAKGTVKKAFGVSAALGGKVAERGKEAFNSNIKVPYQQWRSNRRAKNIENDDRTVTDANGNKTLQHRTWYGRKVTDTLQVNPDGTSKVTRAKHNLIGGKASSVENDKFIQTKKTYDKNGNVIKEESSMNTAAGKYLLNKDGTRNEVAIFAIRNGSNMSKDDIDKAIMQQMMQERMGNIPGADMNREFKNRTMERTLDAKGREVLTIKQTNTDGSTSIFQMTKGEKRDLLSYTRISKSGKAQSYSSDGIVTKKSSYSLDKDGKINEKTLKNNYAFAHSFNSSATRSMDSNGKFNKYVPADQIMMSEEDMRMFQEQIALYGKDSAMSEFNK